MIWVGTIFAPRGTVTDAMVKAGAKALSEHDSGLWTRGGTSESELLTAIYRAMSSHGKGTVR